MYAYLQMLVTKMGRLMMMAGKRENLMMKMRVTITKRIPLMMAGKRDNLTMKMRVTSTVRIPLMMTVLIMIRMKRRRRTRMRSRRRTIMRRRRRMMTRRVKMKSTLMMGY